MQLRNSLVALLFGGLTALPALAQFSLPGNGSEEPNRSDVTVQAFGSFVKDTTQSGVRQSATQSGGVLATYRLFFNRNHGVEVNYGYALNTQSYAPAAVPGGVRTGSHEATAAYVLRFPLRHVTPFALAGVGGLVFDPKDTNFANTQARAAFVYGGGADFNLTSRVYFRAQYRGLVYNSPNFDAPGFTGLERVTNRAEPSAGFGVRF